RAGLKHAHQLRPYERSFYFFCARQHAIAGRAAGHEHHAPIGVAPHRLAAEGQRVEAELDLHQYACAALPWRTMKSNEPSMFPPAAGVVGTPPIPPIAICRRSMTSKLKVAAR